LLESTQSLQISHTSESKSKVLFSSIKSDMLHFQLLAFSKVHSLSKIFILIASEFFSVSKQEFAFKATKAIFRKSCFVIKESGLKYSPFFSTNLYIFLFQKLS